MNYVRQWSKLPLVMNAKEAAAIVGVTPYTMGKYLTRGKIPGVRIGGSWKISRDELRSYLEGRSYED